MKDLQNVLLPWYNSNNVIALDNFYGNNPPRYSGAMTYEVTTNENVTKHLRKEEIKE